MPVSDAPEPSTAKERTLPDALMELESGIEQLRQLEERAETCNNEARMQLQELTGETVPDEDSTEPVAESAEPPTDIVGKVFALRRKLQQVQRDIGESLALTQERQERVSRALGIE